MTSDQFVKFVQVENDQATTSCRGLDENALNTIAQTVVTQLKPAIHDMIQDLLRPAQQPHNNSDTTIISIASPHIESCQTAIRDPSPVIASTTAPDTLVLQEHMDLSMHHQRSTSNSILGTHHNSSKRTIIDVNPNALPVNPHNNSSKSTIIEVNSDALLVEALNKIRSIHCNNKLDWTNNVQKTAMKEILDHKSDVVAVMATGAGKSMLMIIPSLIEKNMITVGIIPLKSLLMDYERKLKEKSIPYEVWPGKNNQQTLMGNANLILVLVDQAKRTAWRSALSLLHQRKPLRRIVFDEAHYALTNDGFREALTDVYHFRQESCQMVLLSATVPPVSEVTLCRSFGLTHNATILRTTTNRPEIKYIIDPPYKDFDTIKQKTRVYLAIALQTFSSPADRILIFVTSIGHGIQLAECLQCEFYCGSSSSELHMTDEQRRTVHQNWIKGKYRILIATTAFSAGNDYPSVRLVLHIGWFFNMVEYIQQSGRGGRDHHTTTSQILPLNATHPVNDSPEDLIGSHVIWNMIYGTDQHECIRYLITKFNDGHGIRCHNNTSNRICNRCAAQPELERNSVSTTAISRIPPPVIITHPVATKRPADGDSDNIFLKAQRQCNDRYVSSMNQHTIYANKFLEAARPFEGQCTLCTLHNHSMPYHNILRCPSIQLEYHQTSNYYTAWRKTIQYSQYHKQICWKCHVPSVNADLHGDFDRGKQMEGCRFKDMIAPAAFYVFHNEEVRQKAMSHFKVTWANLHQFTEWLNSRPIVTHYSNITALFLWLYTFKYCT